MSRSQSLHFFRAFQVYNWRKEGKFPPESQSLHFFRAFQAEFGLRPDLGHVIVMGRNPFTFLGHFKRKRWQRQKQQKT